MNASQENVIVLGTYQGETYLPAMLKSLQLQTVRDWQLLVRDDGSTDQTRAILREFSRQDTRVEIIDDERGNLGAVQNFARLMQLASERKAESIFFADQDDVWLPTKLERQLSVLKTETASDPSQPLLVHCDAAVVDPDLKLIHPSFWKYSRLHHRTTNPLSTLLVHNFITGCMTAINRQLLEHALPVPQAAIMHDWWLGLLAASSGKIVSLDERLMNYRQHFNNAIGAKNRSLVACCRELLTRQRDWNQDLELFEQTLAQATALRETLTTMGQPSSLLDEYCEAWSSPSVWKQRKQVSRLNLPVLRKLLCGYRAGLRNRAMKREKTDDATLLHQL